MKNKYIYILLLFALFYGISLSSEAQYGKKLKKPSPLESRLMQLGFVDIRRLDPTIQVDLKYATTDNFTGIVLYDDGLSRAYLHPLAAAKLIKAQQILKKKHPNLSLLVYDAVRPLNIQRKMYKVVENTPLRAYVAHPERTGLHNYGMAVDLTICDENSKALDMGTPFDYFGHTAGIRNEEEFIRQGLLTRQQVENRLLLRNIMTEAGFLPILGEWWHFNAVPLWEARSKYNVVE